MPLSRDGKFALDDVFLRERLREIIQERGIEVVVETGLNEGNSTLEFSRMAPQVIGVDIDPLCIEATRQKLAAAGRNNFTLLTGHSPDVLRSLVDTLPPDKTLFFLDAHWGEPWPLPEEITTIPRGQNIMVFHDIKVPGTDFGFDGVMFKGQVCDFEYAIVQDVLTAWSPTHRVEYMTVAYGSYRGAAILYPA